MTGLTTIDLSLMTAWQQVITFLLMFLGSPVSRTLRHPFNSVRIS